VHAPGGAVCRGGRQAGRKWGEVPCAFIELKDGARATEAEIIAFCRNELPGFKSPKAVVFGVLPKTSTGKIQKFELRNQVKSASAIGGV
jgi:fatty-acyl-CoA synthase